MIKLCEAIFNLITMTLKIITMKKVFIAALFLIGITSFAQEKKVRTERAQMDQMTMEQKNQLRVKKMTLDLDLSTSQHKEVEKIITEKGRKKEAKIVPRQNMQGAMKKKLNSEERFARKNQILEEQIVMKGKMQKILSSKQFDKWESLKSQRKDRLSKRMVNRNNRKKANSDDTKK